MVVDVLSYNDVRSVFDGTFGLLEPGDDKRYSVSLPVLSCALHDCDDVSLDLLHEFICTVKILTE